MTGIRQHASEELRQAEKFRFARFRKTLRI